MAFSVFVRVMTDHHNVIIILPKCSYVHSALLLLCLYAWIHNLIVELCCQVFCKRAFYGILYTVKHLRGKTFTVFADFYPYCEHFPMYVLHASGTYSLF